ncbi:MAG: hypothetical protein MZV64_42330 [Ignavibacteriales bacterium]|nr:hypothetical protein [Ignavibacteriales bacterium]
MSAGVGLFGVAGLGTAFLCLCLVLLNRLGAKRPRAMMAEVEAEGREFPTAHVQSVFARNQVIFEPREVLPGQGAVGAVLHAARPRSVAREPQRAADGGREGERQVGVLGAAPEKRVIPGQVPSRWRATPMRTSHADRRRCSRPPCCGGVRAAAQSGPGAAAERRRPLPRPLPRRRRRRTDSSGRTARASATVTGSRSMCGPSLKATCGRPTPISPATARPSSGAGGGPVSRES